MYRLGQQRNYNHVYTCWRFIVQVIQHGQHDGILVNLLPSLTVAILNDRLIAGVSFEWICGDINVGIMRCEFQEGEKNRRQRVKDEAAKMGVTPRQYALRWGW